MSQSDARPTAPLPRKRSPLNSPPRVEIAVANGCLASQRKFWKTASICIHRTAEAI
jgi:hypothetical protein